MTSIVYFSSVGENIHLFSRLDLTVHDHCGILEVECTKYISLAGNVLNAHDLRATREEFFPFESVAILNLLVSVLALQI